LFKIWRRTFGEYPLEPIVRLFLLLTDFTT
jgi:hypothetical protein